MPGIQESDRHQHIGIPEKLIKEPDSGKEKEQIMEFIAECKLMGDGYAGGFSCGMRRPFPFTERRQRSSDPGKTTRIECSTESYNHPEGQQLVIREYEGKRLIIFHRFRDSAELPDHILRDSRIIAEFGRVDKDFTAAAYLVENGRTS